MEQPRTAARSPDPSVDRPVPAFTGAVLVGGESRRMGTDKALLRHEGETLLSLQLARLRGLGARQLIVSDRAASSQAHPSGAADAEWVTDARAGVGPFAGIESTVRAAIHDWIVVLAVDLPALNSGFLRKLIAGLRPGCGRVPWVDGAAEPLCAVYPRQPLGPALVRQALSQDWALHRLVETGTSEGWLERWDVVGPETQRLVNWNRPGDWPRHG